MVNRLYFDDSYILCAVFVKLSCIKSYLYAGKSIACFIDFAKNLLHAFFYEDISPEDYVKTNGISKNDWFSQVAGHLISNDKPQEDVSSDVTSSVESEITSSDSSLPESGDSSIPTTSEGENTSSDIGGTDENTSSDASLPGTSSGEGTNNSSGEASSQVPSTPTTPSTPPTSSQQGTTSENSTTQRVKK